MKSVMLVCLFCFVLFPSGLGVELRALCMPGRWLRLELHPQPWFPEVLMGKKGVSKTSECLNYK